MGYGADTMNKLAEANPADTLGGSAFDGDEYGRPA